jgi:hypothetical protein
MSNFYFVNNDCLIGMDCDSVRGNFWLDVIGSRVGQYWASPVPRLGEFPTPWNMTLPSELNVPKGYTKDSFKNITDQLATKLSLEKNKVAVLYSGGIDSTLVVSAIIKNWSPEDQKRVTVYLTNDSIYENPNFYRNHIQHRFQVKKLSYLLDSVYQENDLVITGIGGDEIAGPQGLLRIFDSILDQPYINNIDNLSRLHYNNCHYVDLLAHNIKSCSAPVSTVWDFLWWEEFNFKAVSSAYTNMAMHSTLPIPDLCQKTLHWFMDPAYQSWAMSRHEATYFIEPIKVKTPLKKYIFDLDQNAWYYNFKPKIGSMSTPFPSTTQIFGITESGERIVWNSESEEFARNCLEQY